jgi:hypothetical protein
MGRGNLATSGDFTFTTPAAPVGPAPVFQLHLDATEVSGTTNGSTITPAVAPTGFTGKVVVTGTGSVNYTPAQSGDGVYFKNCCDNSNNAYYHFNGTGVGSLFSPTQGQITFYLKSRYSFAQRQASATGARFAFDVRDGTGAHQMYFFTQPSSGSLTFVTQMGGATVYYYARPRSRTVSRRFTLLRSAPPVPAGHRTTASKISSDTEGTSAVNLNRLSKSSDSSVNRPHRVGSHSSVSGMLATKEAVLSDHCITAHTA